MNFAGKLHDEMAWAAGSAPGQGVWSFAGAPAATYSAARLTLPCVLARLWLLPYHLLRSRLPLLLLLLLGASCCGSPRLLTVRKELLHSLLKLWGSYFAVACR